MDYFLIRIFNKNLHIMKKTLLSFFIVFAMLTSCDVIDELTKFDLDYQTNYSIAPTILIDTPFSLDTPDITTDSESSFENNNTHKDLIESIKLKTIKMTIESPEDGNFNFLKEIYVYINADGLEETEIANTVIHDNTNSNVIELDVLGQELKAYLKEDNFNLRIKTITDETISETHNIVVDTKFRVDAKILGV
ncbi:hypothetical protein SAMN04489797_1532 [Winogradskyella sediminis]|uniref:Uncharacterized protein n=2 Tax=Winogradskyella sediminis TaxID=1382466 RepID=A0A1H1RXR3_9FLAO|nr:hypothetical protein SAMN04489797_1532 [Winogradskyella sediminis]